MKSFKKLSDCLMSCGNDGVCSGVEFDFSNQICLRKNCDPLDQSNGNTCEKNSNMKMMLNHISAYKCGKNGCCEEDSSGRVASSDCTNSGENRFQALMRYYGESFITHCHIHCTVNGPLREKCKFTTKPLLSKQISISIKARILSRTYKKMFLGSIFNITNIMHTINWI